MTKTKAQSQALERSGLGRSVASGVQVSDKVRRHAREIAKAWRTTVESVIETGRRVMEARDALDDGEWGDLLKSGLLPFGKRHAEKLICIAKDPVVSDATHESRLPPSIETLYQLTRLPREQTLHLIETGGIDEKVLRKEVAAILKRERSPLIAALEDVKPALATTVSTPVLTHYMFTGNCVLVSDGEFNMSVPCKTTFSAAVPPTILDILRTLPVDGFEFERDNNELSIKTKSLRFRLTVMDVYPGLEAPKDQPGRRLEGETLAAVVAGVKVCLRSVGKEGGHIAELAGVTFSFSGEGILDLYATNSRTISKVTIDCGVKKAGRMIVPAIFCRQLIRLWSSGRPCSLNITNTHAILTAGTLTVWSKCTDCPTPFDFEKTIKHHFPARDMKRAVPIPRDLMRALDRADIMTSGTVDQNRVKMTIKVDQLELYCLSDRGELSERVKLAVEHPPAEGVIDAALLKGVLADFAGGNFFLSKGSLALVRQNWLCLVSAKAD